jgi:hypothetical protein
MILAYLLVTVALNIFGAFFWASRPVTQYTNTCTVVHCALSVWGVLAVRMVLR